MHITTRPDSTHIAAWPYPLALKHHDFLKQEVKKIYYMQELSARTCPHGQALL